MTSVLNGTLPLKPFDPRGFVGSVESDGQHPQVAALACTPDGQVICLSLVGAANSVSAAIATLLEPKRRLFFTPADEQAWDEPRILLRAPDTLYRELGVRLRSTRATHGLCLAASAHLGDGLLHPPVIPQPEPATAQQPLSPEGPDELITTPPNASDSTAHLRSALAQVHPRYLLGNADEPAPHRRSFLGVLRGLRVIFVNAPPDAPPALIATMHQWADALWQMGNRRGLIVPLPALGLRAWQLTGNLTQWSDLLSDGVRAGWLQRPPR